MTTIQVRTQDKIKKAAMKILEKLGLDLSTAINIYLVQIIAKQGIPFEILTENGMTPAEEEEILKELASAKKSKKSYATAEEAHRAILGAWICTPSIESRWASATSKDIRRLKKSGRDFSRLTAVINQLATGEILTIGFHDHELRGRLQNTRECHIGPDWLLRYAKDDDVLVLMLLSTGDHRRVLGTE